MRSAILFLLLATSAVADEAMDAAAFDAYTIGRTFAFAYDGEAPYGTELYLPNRQVIWVEQGGHCLEGKWFQSGENICFRYRNLTRMTCSAFYPDGEDMWVVPPYQTGEPAHRATLTERMLPSQCEAPMS